MIQVKVYYRVTLILRTQYRLLHRFNGLDGSSGRSHQKGEQGMSNHLARATEIALDRLTSQGRVTMHDFLAGMPYLVDEKKRAVQALVDQGMITEIPSPGLREADRVFIRPGIDVPPIGTE